MSYSSHLVSPVHTSPAAQASGVTAAPAPAPHGTKINSLPVERVTGASSSKADKQPAKSQSPSTVATQDRPSFTFIDHNDSFESKTKRTTDSSDSRKAIRSHVMRDVRRRERLAGLKRPTRKEEKKTASANKGKETQNTSKKRQAPPKQAQTQASSSSSNSVTPTTSSNSPSSGRTKSSRSRPLMSPGTELALTIRTSPRLTNSDPARKVDDWSSENDWSPESSRRGKSDSVVPFTALSPRMRTPGLTEVDPFCTLPGGVGESAIVDSLIKYCASVFIPMTFPAEKGVQTQINQRMMSIFESAMLKPNVFYGYLCINASHRSTIQRKAEPDLGDYYMMKAKCIAAVNEMLANPKTGLCDDAIEIIILLETATMLLGFHQEAFMHLIASRKMCRLRGGVNPQTFASNPQLMHSLLIADVKSSVGMLSRPCFPLPWPTRPISHETYNRIFPAPDSPLNSFATAFQASPHLSPEIRSILTEMRILAFFDEYNTTSETGLSATDHEVNRIKTYELEHNVLSYPYSHLPAEIVSIPNPLSPPPMRPLDPIEAITRVAALMYLNVTTVVSDPNSGLARQLVSHLLQSFTGCPWSFVLSLPEPYCQDVLLWALFMGAHGSQKAKEQHWFVEKIADLAAWRGWRDVEAVKAVLRGYLYLDRRHGKCVETVWEAVLRVLEGRNTAMGWVQGGVGGGAGAGGSDFHGVMGTGDGGVGVGPAFVGYQG